MKVLRTAALVALFSPFAPALAGNLRTQKCPGPSTQVLYDFEEFQAGDVIQSLGGGDVEVSAMKRKHKKPALPMAFDTANPTGNDLDLSTHDEGMVLIVSEDGIASDPNHNKHGSVLTFKFNREKAIVNEVLILDPEDGGLIKVWKMNGITKEFQIPAVGNGGHVSVRLAVRGVVKMVIKGSGAIPWIDVMYCDEPTPMPSSSPSALPSSAPSLAPTFSFSPTASPAPSASPSISPAPSSSPTTINEGLPFSFGYDADDTFTGASDDGSSSEFVFPFPMKFFNQSITTATQNTNGHVTFDAPYDEYSPESLPDLDVPSMVAVYWTDFNTKDGGGLWARVTENRLDLEKAKSIISASGQSDFEPLAAFISTWHEVANYGQAGKNTFQLALAFSNDDETWAILSYRKLEADEVDAVAGFNDQDSGAGFTMAAMQNQQDMEDLLSGSNCGVSGTYVHRMSDDNPFAPTAAPSFSMAPSASPSLAPSGMPSSSANPTYTRI